MKRIKLFILGVLLSSCGHLPSYMTPLSDNSFKPLEDYKPMMVKDYQDQLESLSQSYQNTKGVEFVKLTNNQKKYLESLVYRIIDNNELFLSNRETPKFFVVKDTRPFYFSLPGNQFFFSTGLFNKYIKNEVYLATILSQELIKSQKLLYPKKFIIPVGYIQTDKLIEIVQVPPKVRDIVNKWSFHTMKRANFDGNAILSWLQIMNRNSSDFYIMSNVAGGLSREEFQFKNFMATQGVRDYISLFPEEGSSSFYNLSNYIERVAK